MSEEPENNNVPSEGCTDNKGNDHPIQVDVEGGKPVTVARSRCASVRRVSCRIVVMLAVLSAVFGVFAVLWYYLGWISIIQLILVAIVAYLAASGAWKWFYVAVKTAPRDAKGVWAYVKLLIQVKKYTKKNMTIPDIFDEVVAAHPDKPCFLFEDQVWTFAQVQEYSYRIANVFHEHGYRSGQAVGLLAGNCPQYPAIWMGLARLGVVVPLINTNQRTKSLLHSITVGKCNAVIYGEEFEQAIKDVSTDLDPSISLYRWSPAPLSSIARNIPNPGSTGAVKDLSSLLAAAAVSAPVRSPDKTFHDKVLYIYTSGTTGLPKAAVITHSRYMFMCGGIHHLSRLTPSDIVYTSLPLYHTAGCVTALGQALVYGNTVAIRNKFSASNFIKDCIKFNATIANYIGEMCRYLLAVPPGPIDKQHKLRLMFGNGLRPQIWQEFIDRFNIPMINEFYGATEGNANIVNIDGTVGSIGFVSKILPQVYPIALIKVDERTGEPIRNARGFCQLCEPHEPGVFIGKIQPSNPTRAFLGYVDKAASEKKIVHNVFKTGDTAFISGDILVSDELGYLFFKDRTGDTFRWRGENVSTSEVEAAVSQIANHRDAVVYGVLIPHVEGRAGMCGIADPEGNLDLVKLAAGLSRDLPPYARPIFIRVLKQVDMTGTFKMKKTDLQEQGFNPSTITDKLYYIDQKTAQYLPLTQDAYDKINTGQIRL